MDTMDPIYSCLTPTWELYLSVWLLTWWMALNLLESTRETPGTFLSTPSTLFSVSSFFFFFLQSFTYKTTFTFPTCLRVHLYIIITWAPKMITRKAGFHCTGFGKSCFPTPCYGTIWHTAPSHWRSIEMTISYSGKKIKIPLWFYIIQLLYSIWPLIVCT